MATVKVDITFDMGRVKRLDRAAVVALEKTAKMLHTEIRQAQVMPRDTGNLQNEKTYVDYSQSELGHVDIVTEGPYARRLYYHPEYHFQTDENPNAGGKWLEPWLPGGEHENVAQDAFNRIYKREAGI